MPALDLYGFFCCFYNWYFNTLTINNSFKMHDDQTCIPSRFKFNTGTIQCFPINQFIWGGQHSINIDCCKWFFKYNCLKWNLLTSSLTYCTNAQTCLWIASDPDCTWNAYETPVNIREFMLLHCLSFDCNQLFFFFFWQSSKIKMPEVECKQAVMNHDSLCRSFSFI